jgi:hypothetical protein
VIHPRVGEGPAVRKRSWAWGFVVVAFYAVIISVGALVVVGLVVGLLLKGS